MEYLVKSDLSASVGETYVSSGRNKISATPPSPTQNVIIVG